MAKRGHGGDKGDTGRDTGSIPVFTMLDLAAEDGKALEVYRKYRVLHVRAGCDSNDRGKVLKALKKALKRDTKIKESWCVENDCGNANENLSIESILGIDKKINPSCKPNFYVSCIVQGNKDVVNEFSKDVEFVDPPPFVDSGWRGFRSTKPLWLFYGINREQLALSGRPEHTDSVEHDGTWHAQIQGSKRWWIRPMHEHDEWNGKAPKDAACVDLQAGDLFMINTRLWWHRTELLNNEDSGGSISIARDFYCPAVTTTPSSKRQKKTEGEKEEDEDIFMNREGVYASKAVPEGQVILTEDELPDCELVRSTEPNAFVSTLDTGAGCLVALRDITAGEFLSVAPSDDESEEGDCEDCGVEYCQDCAIEGEEEEEEEDEEGGEDDEDGEEEESSAGDEEEIEEVGF